MNDVFLSVIIPSYNETENLQRGVLGEVRDYLSRQKYTWEVIVSEDESPDLESRRLAKEFCDENRGFLFLQNKHGGKALAVWAGIQKSSGMHVLFADMDQSTPISEAAKLLPYFDQGFEVIIGSRGLERKNFSPFRKLASVTFRTFRGIFVLGEIVDTQAGFKAFTREAILKIFPKLEAIRNSGGKAQGWTVGSWDTELLFIAKKWRYKIKEVPIVWEDRDESVAKAKERQQGKFFKESLDMIKQIFRVRINDLMGFYEK